MTHLALMAIRTQPEYVFYPKALVVKRGLT